MRVSTRHGNTTRLRISLRSAMLPESALQCLQERQTLGELENRMEAASVTISFSVCQTRDAFFLDVLQMTVDD